MAFEKIGSINRSRIFQICLEFADESGLEYQILAKSRVLKERVLKEFYAEHPEIVNKIDSLHKTAHRHPHIREWEFVDPKFKK